MTSNKYKNGALLTAFVRSLGPKFDSVFITGGIHKKEIVNLPIKDYDNVLRKYKTTTNYYQESLNW